MWNIFFFFIFLNDFRGFLNKVIFFMVVVYLFVFYEVDYMLVNFGKGLFFVVLLVIRYFVFLLYIVIFIFF